MKAVEAFSSILRHITICVGIVEYTSLVSIDDKMGKSQLAVFNHCFRLQMYQRYQPHSATHIICLSIDMHFMSRIWNFQTK